MEPINTLTHPTSSGTNEDDDLGSIYTNRPTSLLPIDIFVVTPLTDEVDELLEGRPRNHEENEEQQEEAAII